jgi:sugar phosphate isomerase/epimerase
MIENMPGYNELGYSPDEIKEIIESSGKDNVKFILDFGHAHVSDYPIEEYIDKLGDKLMHLHISDNNGTSDQHKPIGFGNIDYVNVFKYLKNYTELYCLEIIYKTDKDLINYLNSLENVL